MAGMTKALSKFLTKAETFITNGKNNPEIAAAMAKFGYTEEKWNEGQALFSTAQEKITANGRAYANQLALTDQFNEEFDEAWDLAQTLANVCAVVFEDDTGKLKLLGLHKKRDETDEESELAWPNRTRAFTTFLPWARNLYSVCQTDADVADIIADFDYPLEKLQQEAVEVEEAATKNSEQENAKATAQQSTVERDDAVNDLKAWVSKARKFAKIALKGKKQLLEALGMTVRR
jgi:hypothetical protein